MMVACDSLDIAVAALVADLAAVMGCCLFRNWLMVVVVNVDRFSKLKSAAGMRMTMDNRVSNRGVVRENIEKTERERKRLRYALIYPVIYSGVVCS